MKDATDVTGLKCEKKVIAVYPTPSEKASYLEVMDFVVSNEFKSGAEGGDGKKDLFLSCSADSVECTEACHFITATEKYEAIERTRAREYSELLAEFRSTLSTAHSLSIRRGGSGTSIQDYDEWFARARTDYYGDPSTTADIRSAMDSISKQPLAQTGEHDKMTRTLVAELNKFCLRLVSRNRSLRLFVTLGRVSSASELTCSDCHQPADPDDMTLLSHCGHLVCSKCTISIACGVIQEGDRCNATIASHQRLSCASLRLQTSSDLCSRFSSKIDYVVKLIQDKIDGHSIPNGEKVLLFLQHIKTREKLEAAFQVAGIKFINLSSSRDLENFKNPGKGVQVLIMSIGDVAAAGR